MRLLVLGGTLFLGRHLVVDALRRGHDVTLFHRGRTNAALFPELEHVLGDRDGGLEPLAKRSFDAVVDTCGYVPRIVDASASLLAPACDHYVFVSTGPVYAPPLPARADESHPVAVLDHPTTETIDGATYGPLKALCEKAVRRSFPGRSTIVRAGLIVGPHDPTDRFTYWPRRVARGGDLVCPPDPRQPVQWIDVRDLAAWMLTCAERRTEGTFNAIGPPERLDFESFVQGVADALGADATPRWTPADVLTRHEVSPWMGLPLWLPEDAYSMLDVDGSAACAAGLVHRSLAETTRDTAAWASEIDRPARAGIAPEVESAILTELLA